MEHLGSKEADDESEYVSADGPTGTATNRTNISDETNMEPCLANKEKLSKDTLSRIVDDRRRLLHAIRRINRQQAEFCQPDEVLGQVPYRKCPIWRQKKIIYYHELMRITYCTDSESWPTDAY